jgi:hypothetical protein
MANGPHRGRAMTPLDVVLIFAIAGAITAVVVVAVKLAPKSW